jgi:hypothetical protein
MSYNHRYVRRILLMSRLPRYGFAVTALLAVLAFPVFTFDRTRSYATERASLFDPISGLRVDSSMAKYLQDIGFVFQKRGGLEGGNDGIAYVRREGGHPYRYWIVDTEDAPSTGFTLSVWPEKVSAIQWAILEFRWARLTAQLDQMLTKT